MDREKHFDLRYLNVPLPEDVEKLKWGETMSGFKR